MIEEARRKERWLIGQLQQAVSETVVQFLGKLLFATIQFDEFVYVVGHEERISPSVGFIKIAFPRAPKVGGIYVYPLSVFVSGANKALKALAFQVGVPHVHPAFRAFQIFLVVAFVTQFLGCQCHTVVVIGVFQGC